MEGFAGLLPFALRRAKKRRYHATYQSIDMGDGLNYFPRRRKVVVKTQSARLGRRSWGLRVSKLRLSILRLPPLTLLRRFRDAYVRMTCKVTTTSSPAAATKSESPTRSRNPGTVGKEGGLCLEYFNKDSGLRAAAGFTVR